MDTQWTNVGLMVAGAVIVAAGIWLRGDLSGRSVIDLDSDRLQFKLKTNAFGMVLLIGVIVGASGVFLHYKNYEAEVARINAEVERIKAEQAGLRTALDQLNRHKLRLNLMFPTGDAPAPGSAFKPKVLVRTGQSNTPVPYSHARVISEFAGLVADVQHLNTGDVLKVVIEADDGKRIWQSDDVIAPAAQLRMHRVRH
jgi:hypothetical protein